MTPEQTREQTADREHMRREAMAKLRQLLRDFALAARDVEVAVGGSTAQYKDANKRADTTYEGIIRLFIEAYREEVGR